MFGLFRKNKINDAIEKTYNSINPIIDSVKMQNSGELPTGFWMDHYIIMFFSTQIGLLFNSITEGNTNREERGFAIAKIFEKICPEDSQQVMTKFNILARNPDEDSTKGINNASNLMGISTGTLRPEFEKEPEIVRAKKMAKQLKPEQAAIFGSSGDYTSVATALLIIYLTEYVEEKFK